MAKKLDVRAVLVGAIDPRDLAPSCKLDASALHLSLDWGVFTDVLGARLSTRLLDHEWQFHSHVLLLLFGDLPEIGSPDFVFQDD